MKHSDGAYYDIFGNKIEITQSGIYTSFNIYVYDTSVEVCQNIYTLIKDFPENLYYWTTDRPKYIYAEGPNSNYSDYCETNKNFEDDSGCISNLTPQTIMRSCTEETSLNTTWTSHAVYTNN